MAAWIPAAIGIVSSIMGAMSASDSASATAAMAAAQERIANRQLAMAEALNRFWSGTYKPEEAQQLADAIAGVRYPYVPRYNQTAGRMANTVKISFQHKLRDALRCNSRYCTGLTSQMVKDFSIAEALATSAAMNYAFRYEEAKAQALEDRAWSRREQALNLGRGMRSEAAAYSKTAAGIYGTLGQQASAAAGGALRLLGYGLERAFGRQGIQNMPQQYPNQPPSGAPVTNVGYSPESAIGAGIPQGFTDPFNSGAGWNSGYDVPSADSTSPYVGDFPTTDDVAIQG